MRRNSAPSYHNDAGEEVTLPWKWAICESCRGNGSSSAYLGAYTRDDLDEMGPEWCEDYFAGNFDRACEVCDGTGKIKVVDSNLAKPEDIERFKRAEDEIAEMDREQYAEWLFCGGWQEMGWR